MYSKNDFEPDLKEFENLLANSGAHTALGFLNRRTPHRFSGIYKFDEKILRNIMLYDSYYPAVFKGEDAPMVATYCSLVKTQQKLEIHDAPNDKRVNGKIITPVISYCGVLIKDDEGNPFGTLCHFDMKRCQERISDFSLMEEAGKLFFLNLKKDNQN